MRTISTNRISLLLKNAAQRQLVYQHSSVQCSPHTNLVTGRKHSTYGYEQAKCLVYSENGEPHKVLRLHGHSISPPHDRLITARMLAAPINPADINTIQGTYPSKPKFDTSLGTADPVAVPGNEGVAEVLALGADAAYAQSSNSPDGAAGSTKPQRGDWVILRRPALGTWRTHVQLPGEDFVPLPKPMIEGITPLQAATVSVNPCTAWAMLKGWTGTGAWEPAPSEVLPKNSGEWVIQNGANSGVGRAVIQIARAHGLRSVNVIRARPNDKDGKKTEALKNELRQLGADVVYTEDEVAEKGFSSQRLQEEALDGGRWGIRLGLNCVGGKSALNLAKALQHPSTSSSTSAVTNVPLNLVTYGAMAKQPLTLPAGFLIFRPLRASGFWVSEWSRHQPEAKTQALQECLQLMREDRLKEGPWSKVRWSHTTKQDELLQILEGSLDGFKSGKGCFVFDDA